MINKYITVSLLLLVSFVSFGQSPKAWSLRECVDYALDNNISVKQAEVDTRSAAEDIVSAKGNFLPNLSGSASMNYNFGSYLGQNGNRISLDSRGNNFGLNTGVIVFNGFRNTLLYKQSKLGLESSQIQLDILKDNISLNVVNAYLNILLNKENLKLAEEQVNISQAQVDQINELVEAGVRPRKDLLDANAQLASDNERLVNAQNSVDLSLLSLAQLLQISKDNFDVEDILIELANANLEDNSPNDIFNYAVGNRPEIKSAELNIKNSEYNVEIAKSSYYPTLSFGAGASTSYQHTQGQDDVIPLVDNQGNVTLIRNNFWDQLDNNLGYNFGFNLSVPIFNRFQTKSSVSKAKINKERVELALEQEKQTLRTNIEQAYADAKATLNQYLSSQASVQAQEEAFNNAQDSYNLGAMTSFDFEQVRNRLINAQSSLINAKYNFVFKTKVLDFYLGKSLTE